jgi:tetratricopeptide (TPR) repeat protein
MCTTDCKIRIHCGLPVSVISAALLTGSLALFAQIPGADLASNTPPSGQSVAPQPEPEAVGDALMAHHRYQAAIEAYHREPQPTSRVWNKLGIANQMLFNMPEATRCYKQSLKLVPKSADVLNNLATVYDAQRQYKTAVRMYQKALKANPRSALVLKNLGTDLLAQHKYKKGWEAYQQALAIDPEIFERDLGPKVENPASLQQRGAMNFYMAKGCVRAGQNERAIEYLRMAIDEGFTDPKKIATDEEFAGLRDIPAFKQLLSAQKE